MNGGTLSEAYQRFGSTGPEWSESQLTNHGPMAAEVLVRRGHAAAVESWVDRYLPRLEPLPGGRSKIEDWREALGDGRRLGDWSVFFRAELARMPWQDLLDTWWPRLLPGIVAGTTHGVIRTGHVVRVLLAGGETETSLDELGHALAFWAARYRSAPGASRPWGDRGAAAALDALPRIASQAGTVAQRFGRLDALPGWAEGVAALEVPHAADRVLRQLADLVTAGTLRYLHDGHASPVILVHLATAPNAVLHTLPALSRELWAPSLGAIWTAVAAIHAAYAPAGAASSLAAPIDLSTQEPIAELMQRAVDHGDEHVIKFTDTACEVYTRTGDPGSLAAALHVATLIGGTSA